MYSKIGPLKDSLDANAAETVADILFEIGRDLSSRRYFSAAVTWLDRARETISRSGHEKLSRDAAHSGWQSRRRSSSPSWRSTLPRRPNGQAASVRALESELGDTPVVLLLQLELLNKTPVKTFDAEAHALYPAEDGEVLHVF